jgi:hypothetical protein
MTLRRMAWLVGAGTLLVIGCVGPTGVMVGTGGAGGHGGGATTASDGGGGGTGGASSSSTASSSSGTGGSAPVEPSGFTCSGASPSLSNDVVPITAANCSVGTGCHVAAKTANGLYDQFVNRIAEQCSDSRLMIKPSDPEHSYVIHKITNHNICVGQTMPKDQAMIDAAKVQVIYDWICTGAPNN